MVVPDINEVINTATTSIQVAAVAATANIIATGSRDLVSGGGSAGDSRLAVVAASVVVAAAEACKGSIGRHEVLQEGRDKFIQQFPDGVTF